ncbi:hypothetical protein PIROE2DRAFT_62984 [Piromyces sp. E2]|nr:hypothetical protein PIROE2DRAFT_62984 [Piromyces sp. E2]|eukprot:OUM60697.1 hypothetical protein PIROE2DRAFT_62984 [Piromyces sp. E2]
MQGKIENNGKIEDSYSIIKCESNHCMIITRWELGKINYFSYTKFLYINYEGTEKKFNEESKKADLTSEMENIFKTLPESIGTCSELRMLKTYSNREERICLNILPTSIGNLNKLKILDLSYNKLESLPDSIGNLKNLNELNLSFNYLKTLPDSIGNLKNLEELDISHNYSFSRLPYSIGNLENLKILRLKLTNLESLPESMENLTHLEELSLSGNKTRYYGRSSSSIVDKDYSHNWFYDIIKKSFIYWSCSPPANDNWKSLSSLDLSGKKLKQIPFGVYMITGLKELDISNNQLTKISLLLGRLIHLEKLYIHNNPNLNHLSDFLWNMRYLKELKIDGKLIKDLPKNAKISLCENVDNDAIVDLTLAGKNNKKLNDQELSNKTGPYIVYLTKN